MGCHTENASHVLTPWNMVHIIECKWTQVGFEPHPTSHVSTSHIQWRNAVRSGALSLWDGK